MATTIKLSAQLEAELLPDGTVALSLEYTDEPGQTSDYIVLSLDQLAQAYLLASSAVKEG